MVTLRPIHSGEQLRRLRVISKLSQTDLAEILDLSRGTIARWEQLDDLSNYISFKQMETLNELFYKELQQ